MTFEARVIDEATYGAHLAGVPAVPVAMQPPWLRAIAQSAGATIVHLGFYQGPALRHVLPLVRRRLGPLVLYGAPLRRTGAPPAGPLLLPLEDGAALLLALDRWLAAARVNFFQITWPGPAPVLPGRAWSEEALENLELDLRPGVEALWQGLSQLPRRMVRRAVREGVRLHWRRPREILAAYRALLNQTYGRQSLRPNLSDALMDAMSAGLPDEAQCVLCATQKGQPVAAAWLLRDGRRLQYWDAASSEHGRDVGAGHLLIWSLLRWATRHGYDTLDFVGTPVGGRGGSRPGIGRFKMSFGATARPYRILYRRAAWVGFALRGYRFWLGLRNRPRLDA